MITGNNTNEVEMKQIAYVVLMGLALAGCSPRISSYLESDYDPLEAAAEVIVLDKNAAIPDDAESLGIVKVGDTGFTTSENGSYEAVVALVKEQARMAGGNVVRIISHREPDRHSTIHRIEAEVFRVNDEFAEEAAQSSKQFTEEVVSPAVQPVFADATSFRLAIQGGGTYRLGKAPSNVEKVISDHADRLRWGGTYGADATYFFLDYLGAGIKFHGLHVGNRESIIATLDDGSTRVGYLEDRIFVWFLGPVITGRLLTPSKRNALHISYGAGYMGYHDNATMLDAYVVKGGTLGYMTEIGFDLGLSKHFALGTSLSYYNGSLTKGKITDSLGNTQTVTLEKDEYESLTHLDLSIGVRFTF